MRWISSQSSEKLDKDELECFIRNCSLTKLVKLLDRGWITREQFDKEISRRHST